MNAKATRLPHSPAPTTAVIAAVRWDEVFARNQQVASQLALRGWDVLYVEPPVTWLSPLRHLTARRHMRLHSTLRRVPVSTEHVVRVLSLPPSLPFGLRQRWLNRQNQRRMADAIAQAAQGPLVLLSYLPGAVDLIPHLQPQVVIYDCADDHASFPGTHNPNLVRRLEAELTAASHAVFATAHNLADRLRRLRPDVMVLPNAAEVDRFRRAETLSPHPMLDHIPTPRVGFVGGIGAWVDQSYIASLAALCPNCQIVLIGPALTDVSRLRRIANVHLLGPQPYPELPRFLAGFTATLFPFVPSPLTESVNPVKVYEYIAAGREVIATPNRETAAMERLLWLAASPAEAAAALGRILTGEKRCRGPLREQFLAENSWAERVNVIEQAIRVHLATALS
ncbi:MAG: glycosyltransferase [Alicyclobacillus herbarius]|uniref:glycosyltransferase n=1 Tax=Alicyclobacillus herbarius TaxID=122960 RepID=UPI0023580059|nr:glycosyltransferase [Alicyclobacillus herbarius]MCL6632200.1 glycosyltransferase [Alicyclobacillus herbarius]